MKSFRKAALALGVVVGAALAAWSTPLAAQHDMSQMGASSMPMLPLGIPLSRLGSGTSWIPDAATVHAAHRTAGDWTLMLHGSFFGQYDRQNGFRGDRQLGVIDWEMVMAMRRLGGGLLRSTLMTSLQPFVIDAQGYPELLQTGGSYNRARLVNRQHPHDLVTELSATYDHSLTSKLAASLYVAAVGEPALGPVAYMHRPSGENDPFTPIGHHWQDVTHESQGVVTLGLYGKAVKLEGSVFNGRERDNSRFNIDGGMQRLDSYSGRLTIAPNAHVAVSGWGGYVFAHDPLDAAIGMQRYGASILTTTKLGGRSWSNGAVWGLNIHHHGDRAHNHEPGVTMKPYHLLSAYLLESSMDVTRRLTVYARAEQVQKIGDDLGFLVDAMTPFNLRTFAVGATQDIRAFGSASVGLGARAALNTVPETLRLVYQGTSAMGYSVYVRVRPVGR